MKKRTKQILIIISILLVVIAIVFFIAKPKKAQEIELQSVKVSNQNLSTSITATGTIEPINKVDVGTQVSGKVTKLYVDYNSLVKKDKY